MVGNREKNEEKHIKCRETHASMNINVRNEERNARDSDMNSENRQERPQCQHGHGLHHHVNEFHVVHEARTIGVHLIDQFLQLNLRQLLCTVGS